MKSIIIGSLSFLLFIIYDINYITYRYKVIKTFFALGSLLLIYATYQLALNGEAIFSLSASVQWILNFFITGFAFLLFYTLFLALPFQKTYMSGEGPADIYDQGVYALSRHPGVLWFIGFYFFLWLRISKPMLLFGGIVFSLLNLFYIWLQDHYIFPKQFTNYSHYQAKTPYLIPTRQSLNKCLNSLPILGVLK